MTAATPGKTQTRRLGVEGSRQRDVLIDAAEAILREEGYVAMSSQKVAARAGLTKQLLYYYFRTMDDLILALVRRVNEHRQARFAAAMDGPDPLAALWALNSDPSGTALATELTAIASHREAVRAEIVTAARQFRAQQVAAVAGLLADRGIADRSAAAIVMVAGAIARTINSEAALGLTEGHAEALALVGTILADLSGD